MKIKFKENKGASNAVIVMLVVFIAILICLLLYFIKNPIFEKTAVQNSVPVSELNSLSESASINDHDKSKNIKKYNFADDLEKFYGESNMGKCFSLGYEMERVEANGGTDDFEANYSACYYYVGDHKGELWVGDKKIELKDNIKDLCLTSTYNGMEYEANEGKKYEYVSKLYILFEDGTVGKIDTNDLKNKDYSIKILSDYKNIDRFITVEPLDSGMDVLLWFIDKDGKAYKVDMVSAGA